MVITPQKVKHNCSKKHAVFSLKNDKNFGLSSATVLLDACVLVYQGSEVEILVGHITFVKIDNKIISIQVGQLSVTGENMCTTT